MTVCKCQQQNNRPSVKTFALLVNSVIDIHTMYLNIILKNDKTKSVSLLFVNPWLHITQEYVSYILYVI